MRQTVRVRFVLLVATAAVAPLLVYGVVSISSLNTGTRQSVVAGNLHVAARAAEQIQQYVDSNIKILRSLAADLRETRLAPWQQDRILKNYVIDFPEYRELTLFDPDRRVVATSRIAEPRAAVPPAEAFGERDVYVSPITIDDDLLPTAVVAIRLTHLGAGAGWLVGELNLEEMWRMVDRIRVGQQGFALAIAREGQLIAHGNPDEKARVARGDTLAPHPLVRQLSTASTSDEGEVRLKPDTTAEGSVRLKPDTTEIEYVDDRGRGMLAVGAPIAPLGWTVIVEQPTREAYALAIQLERQLVVAIVVALLVTIVAGYFWARSFIRPIFALMRGTQAIAAGRLEERVQIGGRDEFHQLGQAFNNMAGRLIELQENVRRQERQAMFGRVAMGLVHDLSNPLQAIAGSCRAIVRSWDDLKYRETFRSIVEREFAVVRRVIEDLRDLARPAPLERVPVEINGSIADVIESLQSLAETAGVELSAVAAPEPLYVTGDSQGLGRVYRNLILNAVQATPPGGRVTVRADARDDRVQVAISDTGCGIPADRLKVIFEDFVTTKRRGLGLGIAISKKLVEQLGGTITVSSEVGLGTTFVLEFPKTALRTAPAAAAAG